MTPTLLVLTLRFPPRAFQGKTGGAALPLGDRSCAMVVP